ncbi:MAG: hypothetical protein LUF04_09245 [Bacteroides sp.]|nr:hypothetical protein [Bacteroides sp.]
MENSKIKATPIEKLCYFGESYTEGSQVPPGGGPVISFHSPTYWQEESRALPPPPPNISDQSTPEKLLAADKLTCYYSGTVTRNLKNIPLTHANALLEFDVIDFPSDTEVKIGSYMIITPYRQDNHYKAIVLAEGGEFDAYIVITAGGKTQKLSLREYIKKSIPDASDIRAISRDTHYKFIIRYNEEDNTFAIGNLHRSKWSGDNYPLDLYESDKQLVEFRLFIGSPEGPVEVSTEEMIPDQFWKERLTYYPESLTFNDDETATQLPKEVDNDTFLYQFKTDSMYRFNPYTERWYLSATGDKYLLNYRRGYFRATYTKDGIFHFKIGQDNEFASEIGLYGDAYSLDLLTRETDSIMWCNIIHTYKNTEKYTGEY